MADGLTKVISAKVNGLSDVISHSKGTEWMPMRYEDYLLLTLDGKKTKVKLPTQKFEVLT